RDACSRATFPSTRAPTAIRCSGTPASFSPRAQATLRKPTYSVALLRSFIASTCPADVHRLASAHGPEAALRTRFQTMGRSYPKRDLGPMHHRPAVEKRHDAGLDRRRAVVR